MSNRRKIIKFECINKSDSTSSDRDSSPPASDSLSTPISSVSFALAVNIISSDNPKLSLIQNSDMSLAQNPGLSLTSNNSILCYTQLPVSFSSDNSDINTKIQKIAEDCGSNIVVRKIVCSEKLIDIPYNMKKSSETSISSLSSSSESNNSDYSDYDTDNSSDLNSDENEKLMDTCIEHVQNIGTDMSFLNTMLYCEKIREVEKKIVEVRLGTAKEYRIPLQKLQDQMKSRLEKASVLRQFKLTNLKHKYEANEQAIEQNFENNKEILYDSIKADLEEKIQQLEEARNEVDVDASLWLDFGRSLTRSGRGRGRRPYDHVQPKRKPVIVSGPCIVYNLREDEILEDWTTIKKLLSASKRKEKKMQRDKPYE